MRPTTDVVDHRRNPIHFLLINWQCKSFISKFECLMASRFVDTSLAGTVSVIEKQVHTSGSNQPNVLGYLGTLTPG